MKEREKGEGGRDERVIMVKIGLIIRIFKGRWRIMDKYYPKNEEEKRLKILN